MSERVLLKCGCVAQGTLALPGAEPVPGCGVHMCVEPVGNRPDLAGRVAFCTYGGKRVPSDFDLPFFEYRGPGSFHSTAICKCGYYRVAHEGGANYRPTWKCTNGGFEPVGPTDDRYYCGCHGWD